MWNSSEKKRIIRRDLLLLFPQPLCVFQERCDEKLGRSSEKGRTIRPHLMKMNASLARNLPTNHTVEARGASYGIKPELLRTSAHRAHYSGFKRFIFLPLKKNDLILVRWLDYISPHQGFIGFKVCVYCVEVTKLTPTRFFMLQKRAVGIINLSKWLSVY